jgi:hypothetical protein
VDRFVTLTYDPPTGRTIVLDTVDPRGPIALVEPDGLRGVFAAAALYAAIGRNVAVRVRDYATARWAVQ